MPAAIPAKTAGSLGEALTDTRTPVANELSAVHVERIKSLLIEISGEIGETASPAEGSILDRLDVIEAPVTPTTEAGTTRTLTDADHGRTILYTNAAGCAITVPHTLAPGHVSAHRQRGAAALTFVGSGGLTVTPPDGFEAETFAAGALAVVQVESATVAGLDGDLAETVE